MDFFELKLENGFTEELDAEATREWFQEHGANMDAVEKALDYCWNFYSAVVTIQNPRAPKLDDKVAPRL